MNKLPNDKKSNIAAQQLNAYSTGLLQGKAYSRLHTSLTRTLHPFRISIPEWKLLGQLYEHGEMKLSDLAVYLSYDPPMVTKLVKLLERKRLVKRTQNKNDERVKYITITQDGNKLINTLEPAVKKTMNEILNGVSREELLTYIKVLTIIVNNTDQ